MAIKQEWVVIENKGVVEENAIALMGASTKRGSGKIGQFGTGFKYGLATLLREGLEVVIYAGEQKISFFTRAQELKGQDFHEVVMRVGQKTKPLGFTVGMGMGWTVERALTDLVSNAYDEDEGEVQHARMYRERGGAKGLAGWTRIWIRLDGGVAGLAVGKFVDEFDRYFTFDRPVLERTDQGRVYAPWGPGARVYRRGVLVWESEKENSAFDYDIPSLPVREDRKADEHTVKYYVPWLINAMEVGKKVEVLRAVGRDSGGFEAKCSAEYATSNPNWQEALQHVGKETVATAEVMGLCGEVAAPHKPLVVPQGWAQGLRQAGVKGLEDVLRDTELKGWKVLARQELPVNEQNVLAEAMNFLDEMGWASEQIWNCEVFDVPEGSEQEPTLGQWDSKRGVISISRRCLQMGVRQVVECLLEEEAHRRSGCADKTRMFQTYLFRQWVETVCRMKGITL